METFAVSVFPVAKPDEWRAFVDSIASGDRADAHRQMLRRLGIKREYIRYQPSPAGDVMVLVWEGVDQDSVAPLLADMLQNPQSEHERYIGTHVIPELHGVDPSAGPPPMMQKVATIEAQERDRQAKQEQREERNDDIGRKSVTAFPDSPPLGSPQSAGGNKNKVAQLGPLPDPGYVPPLPPESVDES